MIIRPESFRGQPFGVAHTGVDREVAIAQATVEVVMVMPAREFVPDVLARHGDGDYLAGIQHAPDSAVDSGDSNGRNGSGRNALELLCIQRGICLFEGFHDCPALSGIAKQMDLLRAS